MVHQQTAGLGPIPTTRHPRRVLLIQPGRTQPGDWEISFKSPILPLGLAMVAGAARAAGHTVKVHDGAAISDRKLKKLRILLEEFAPDVVGLTAGTFRIGDAANTAAMVKAWRPSTPIIIGGWHATAVPVETLQAFTMFDAAAFGEGEKTLNEWLELLESPADWPKIAGLASRQGECVVRGPDRAFITDLDALPRAAYDLFPLPLYRQQTVLFPRGQVVTVATARGCPYHCSFCQNPAGTVVRQRSIASIVAEMADLARSGITGFYFTDETFTVNQKRATQLFEAMIAEPDLRKIYWSAMTRVDAVTPALLKLMRNSGGYLLFYGVESGNQANLTLTNKKIVKEQAQLAVTMAQQAGFFTHIGQIIGLPGETHASVQETIQFSLDLDPDACSFAPLVPFPGTDIWRMAQRGEKGLRILSADWRTYRVILGRPTLQLDNMTAAEIQRWHLRAFARFYLRPRKIMNMFKLFSPLQLIVAATAALVQGLARARRTPAKPLNLQDVPADQ